MLIQKSLGPGTLVKSKNVKFELAKDSFTVKRTRKFKMLQIVIFIRLRGKKKMERD